MTVKPGFSVRIFIPSGEPEGLRIIEKSNWTGQGLVFPRAQYRDIRDREELSRAGVYILWGPGETSHLPRVYVGEADLVRSRLDQHAKQKDFWTHAVVFTSKDQNLNKAHVQYLEARLVELAAEAKRAELDNNNIPQRPAPSEADTADAEGFLADILLCLPVVNVNFFEKPKISGPKARELFLNAKGIEARGIDSVEGFIVREGSQAVAKEVPSCPAYIVQLRRSLVQQGILVPKGDRLHLTQDYIFSSPSAAASVLLARSSNGRTEWKDSKGRTLKEIQELEIGGS